MWWLFNFINWNRYLKRLHSFSSCWICTVKRLHIEPWITVCVSVCGFNSIFKGTLEKGMFLITNARPILQKHLGKHYLCRNNGHGFKALHVQTATLHTFLKHTFLESCFRYRVKTNTSVFKAKFTIFIQLF